MEIVSVIIPTYNRAYCIERAVDSALAQTYPEIEVVVIDDGSQDGTAELLARRYATDSRVRCIRQPNAGVVRARNAGIQAAGGDYVAFLDSDDVWKPWKIELQVRCMQRLPDAGMVWTDMQAVDSSGRLISSKYLRVMYSAYRKYGYTLETLFERSVDITDLLAGHSGCDPGARLYFGDIFSPMVTGNLVHTSTVLIRRSRLSQVGEFDERLTPSGEDFDFHLRTCREGPVAFIDVASIQYQTGCSDQLTDPRYHYYLARNFLYAIQPVIERDRQRIRLPAGRLESVQASAHAWVGRQALIRGDDAEAREYFLQSLRLQPVQPGVWLLLCLSYGPRWAYLTLRATRKMTKRTIRTGGQA